jgi:tRNA A-37 threonylcarbamoyl transferase component Bud32
MAEARLCPQCGVEFPVDAPQGLCPQCLMKAALATQAATPDGSAPSQSLADDRTLPPRNINWDGPSPGTQVRYFGDYELLQEIARGGMGVVWKARQTSLKRDVAIKMIRDGALAGPDEVERFLREAEAAANLQHPNIVAIHEVGEHDGQHYFSMDFVAGRDLGAIVKDGPLSARTAARYVKIIAEAIHFAHQRGTLHRDLKPQNVLIDAADQPRITDFGLAKNMKDDSQLTQSGMVMGSPSYMPPEQAAGRYGDIGPASDVYSLGAMLYELLTGRPPFRAATALATLCQVMEVEPAAPRKLKADVPLDLETICLKCLDKSPSARYPTARVLAEELDRFLKGEPIQARPASAVRKTVSWVRRHPGVLAAFAALVIVALAFGVFYLFEENAFLRARQASPSLVRVRGPRHQSLQNWGIFSILFALSAGGWLFIIVQRRARGASKDLFDRQWVNQPLQPLDRLTRSIAIGGGLILVAGGVTLLAKIIEAHVWEGESILGQIGLIYWPIFCGIAILGIVIRDYRLVHYGLPAKEIGSPGRQLTAEQIVSIRRSLEEHDLHGAIERCRQAVPDASFKEARRFVLALWMAFRAQQPGKFAPPPLSLATLNSKAIVIEAAWLEAASNPLSLATLNSKAMLICALIESIILGVLWYAMRPSYPASAGSQFAYSLLFGMGVIAGLRVKGLWKRLLLLAPSLVVMILSETIVPRLTEASSHSMGPYLCGVFFGILLMVSAFNPRRRRV